MVFYRTIKQAFDRLGVVETYIDKILVWGDTKEQHEKRLILERARAKDLKEKCNIGLQEIQNINLGHVQSDDDWNQSRARWRREEHANPRKQKRHGKIHGNGNIS